MVPDALGPIQVDDFLDETTSVENNLALERDYTRAILEIQKDLWDFQQTMVRGKAYVRDAMLPWLVNGTNGLYRLLWKSPRPWTDRVVLG